MDHVHYASCFPHERRSQGLGPLHGQETWLIEFHTGAVTMFVFSFKPNTRPDAVVLTPEAAAYGGLVSSAVHLTLCPDADCFQFSERF